jgi:hypothetical protein
MWTDGSQSVSDASVQLARSFGAGLFIACTVGNDYATSACQTWRLHPELMRGCLMHRLILGAASVLALAGCANGGGTVASNPYRPGSAAAACWAAGYDGDAILDICNQPGAPAYHAGRAAGLSALDTARGTTPDPVAPNDPNMRLCRDDAACRADMDADPMLIPPPARATACDPQEAVAIAGMNPTEPAAA